MKAKFKNRSVPGLIIAAYDYLRLWSLPSRQQKVQQLQHQLNPLPNNPNQFPQPHPHPAAHPNPQPMQAHDPSDNDGGPKKRKYVRKDSNKIDQPQPQMQHYQKSPYPGLQSHQMQPHPQQRSYFP